MSKECIEDNTIKAGPTTDENIQVARELKDLIRTVIPDEDMEIRDLRVCMPKAMWAEIDAIGLPEDLSLAIFAMRGIASFIEWRERKGEV